MKKIKLLIPILSLSAIGSIVIPLTSCGGHDEPTQTITLKWKVDPENVAILSSTEDITVNKGIKWSQITNKPTFTIINQSYTFKGWFDENGTEYKDDAIVNNSCTITAKFDELPPTPTSSFSWSTDLGQRTATITKFIGNETNIIIPEEYSSDGVNYTVTAIDGSAFSYTGCSSIQSITMPETITTIGNEAFKGCSGLNTITIPKNVTSYGSKLFEDCSNLQILCFEKIDSSWSTTEKLGNANIKNLIILDGIVNEKAFFAYSSLISLYISGSIHNEAFSDCNNLTSLIFLSSPTEVKYKAFANCSKLTEPLTIPTNVNCSGDSIFISSGLKSVIIENMAATWGFSIFKNTPLVNITIKNGVVRRSAFTDIQTIKQVDLGNVTALEGRSGMYGGCFEGCSGIEEITIPVSVAQIGGKAFYNCTSLSKINYNSTILKFTAIEKADTWHDNVPAKQVDCSDGPFPL